MKLCLRWAAIATMVLIVGGCGRSGTSGAKQGEPSPTEAQLPPMPVEHDGLTILEAQWGSGAETKDVRRILEDSIKSGQVHLTADSSTLGEPSPQKKKQLMVLFATDGKQQRLWFAEGTQVSFGAGVKVPSPEMASVQSAPSPEARPPVADRGASKPASGTVTGTAMVAEEATLAELRKEHPQGLVILEARWGKGKEWRDVSGLVQGMVTGDSLTFENTTEAFGEWNGGKELQIKYNDGKQTRGITVGEGAVVQVGPRITSFTRLKSGVRNVSAVVGELRKKYPTGLLVLDARWGKANGWKDVTDIVQGAVSGNSLTARNIAETWGEGWSGGNELTVTYYDGETVKRATANDGGTLQIGTDITSFVRTGKGLKNIKVSVAELRRKFPSGVLVLDANWGGSEKAKDITELCQGLVSGDSLTVHNSGEALGNGSGNDAELKVTYMDDEGPKMEVVAPNGTLQIGKKVTSFVRFKAGVQSVDRTVAELRKQYPKELLILDGRWGKNNEWKDVTDMCQGMVTGDSLTVKNTVETFREGGITGPMLRVVYFDGQTVKETSTGEGGILQVKQKSLGGAPAGQERSSVAPSGAVEGPKQKMVLSGGLELAGEPHQYAVGADMKTGLLLEGDKLTILGPDGVTVVKKIALSRKYVKIGERKEYYVSVRVDPMAMDLLDKNTGKVTKTIKLDYRRFRDLALAPGKAISYVSADIAQSTPHDRIVVVDETTGEVREPKELLGSYMQIDRTGQHMWVGLHDIYQNGTEFFVNPGFNIVDTPTYGDIDYLLEYDLGGKTPILKQHRAEVGANGGPIRLSADGRRVSYLSFAGYPSFSKNMAAFSSADLEKKPMVFDIKEATGGKGAKNIDYHPVLPMVVMPREDGVMIFNSESGDAQPDRVKLSPESLQGATVTDAHFSPDGLNVVIECGNGIKFNLYKVPLLLNEEEKALIRKGIPVVVPAPGDTGRGVQGLKKI